MALMRIFVDGAMQWASDGGFDPATIEYGEDADGWTTARADMPDGTVAWIQAKRRTLLETALRYTAAERLYAKGYRPTEARVAEWIREHGAP
jgi:hypothetical protein